MRVHLKLNDKVGLLFWKCFTLKVSQLKGIWEGGVCGSGHRAVIQWSGGHVLTLVPMVCVLQHVSLSKILTPKFSECRWQSGHCHHYMNVRVNGWMLSQKSFTIWQPWSTGKKLKLLPTKMILGTYCPSGERCLSVVSYCKGEKKITLINKHIKTC